jgi:lysophospholipase L1-like esterase
MTRIKWCSKAVMCALLASFWMPQTASAQVADPDPARFAAEIQAFAEWDEKNAVPTHAVLFAGGSSIRLWNTASRFPGLPVINRGFGGSHISDVNHFVKATVLNYAPDVVVFYAGDNDISAGKGKDRVLADYKTFVARVLSAKPDTDIIFIAIKPSLARWAQWPLMRETNEAVKAYSATNRRLHFADIAPPMLGADGRPRPELFVQDGLHMTPAGYDAWTKVVTASIAAVRKR